MQQENTNNNRKNSEKILFRLNWATSNNRLFYLSTDYLTTENAEFTEKNVRRLR
jgi:hypothetical protein